MTTIEAGREQAVLRQSSIDPVIVDTTVMPTAIAHPTDSRPRKTSHHTPYDGHTLAETIRSVSLLADRMPKTVIVDRAIAGCGSTTSGSCALAGSAAPPRRCT